MACSIWRWPNFSGATVLATLAQGPIHNLLHTERSRRAVVFAQAVTSYGIPRFAGYGRFAPPEAFLLVVRLCLSTDQFHCDKRGEDELAFSGKQFNAGLPAIAGYA
jgi:hypothetical protein